MSAAAVASTLHAHRFLAVDEAELQAQIADVFSRCGIAHTREVSLEVKSPKGRMQPSQARIAWPVVRTPEQAIEAVFG